jgi:hypothetical protein
MRRLITIASCLAVLCLVVLVVWLFVNHNGRGRAPRAEGNPSDDQANHKSSEPIQSSEAVEKKAKAPWELDLPMQIAFLGDDKFSPCYFDLENQTLYLWNGVVLRREQVPDAYKGGISRIEMLDAKNFPRIVNVEALVKYREINGEYRPGYLFRPERVFYEWKGIVLSRQNVIPRSRDGQNAVVELDAVSQVIEIDMPAHLKDQPRRWKSF